MTDKPTWHSFLDESYLLRSKFSERSFYIIAMALIRGDETGPVRKLVECVVGTDYFHATELMRTSSGQNRLIDFLTTLPDSVEFRFLFAEPILSGDRDAEGTRSRLLVESASWMMAEDSNDAKLSFEARRPGAQQQADLRTVAAIKSRFPGLEMRPRSPADERLLWIADAAATAFRQELCWGNSKYFGLLKAKSSVIEIKLSRPD